jgi:cytochrome c
MRDSASNRRRTRVLRHLRVAVLLIVSGLLVGIGHAEDDTLRLGREMVTTYCADCHAVERTGESPHPSAPPFRELHLRYDVQWLSEALVEGLVSGHPDMPEFEFDPAQAEAIVAWLESLSD